MSSILIVQDLDLDFSCYSFYNKIRLKPYPHPTPFSPLPTPHLSPPLPLPTPHSPLPTPHPSPLFTPPRQILVD